MGDTPCMLGIGWHEGCLVPIPDWFYNPSFHDTGELGSQQRSCGSSSSSSIWCFIPSHLFPSSTCGRIQPTNERECEIPGVLTPSHLYQYTSLFRSPCTFWGTSGSLGTPLYIWLWVMCMMHIHIYFLWSRNPSLEFLFALYCFL